MSGVDRRGGVQHYYLAENRTYNGYDATLKTGPYNFGWANTQPDWVERFPYQNGLLVWYVDNEYTDNNTIGAPRWRPGRCPVDARPTAGRVPRRRRCSATGASRSTRRSARRRPTR